MSHLLAPSPPYCWTPASQSQEHKSVLGPHPVPTPGFDHLSSCVDDAPVTNPTQPGSRVPVCALPLPQWPLPLHSAEFSPRGLRSFRNMHYPSVLGGPSPPAHRGHPYSLPSLLPHGTLRRAQHLSGGPPIPEALHSPNLFSLFSVWNAALSVPSPLATLALHESSSTPPPSRAGPYHTADLRLGSGACTVQVSSHHEGGR